MEERSLASAPASPSAPSTPRPLGNNIFLFDPSVQPEDPRRNGSSSDDMRRQLNAQAVFGAAARRLYLLSLADDMVAPTSDQSHAQLAREAGYEVGLVLFREAPHCALVTEDAAKYWSVIQGCWVGDPLPQLDDQAKL